MANFAIAASPDTIQRANEIMDMYKTELDHTKEDTFLRLLDVAAREAVRGTHPQLAPQLETVDKTISALITQINGIVAGQDREMEELRKRLNEEIEAKRTATETATKAKEEALLKITEAKEMLERSKEEVENSKKEAQNAIALALTERDQAMQDAASSKLLADEKTTSNDLLMRQMAEMQDNVSELKALKSSYTKLEEKSRAEYDALKEQLRAARSEAEVAKSEAQNARSIAIAELSEKHAEELSKLRTKLDARTEEVIALKDELHKIK